MIVRPVFVACIFFCLLAGWAEASPSDAPLITNGYYRLFHGVPVLSNDSMRDIPAARRGVKGMDSEAKARLNAVLEQYHDVLEQLHRVSAVGELQWPFDPEKSPLVERPYFRKVIPLASVAFARASVHWNEGRFDEGLADFNAAMRMARHIGSDGFLIASTIETAIETMGIQLAGRELPQWSADSVKQFVRTLDALPPKLPFDGVVDREWKYALAKAKGGRTPLELQCDWGLLSDLSTKSVTGLGEPIERYKKLIVQPEGEQRFAFQSFLAEVDDIGASFFEVMDQVRERREKGDADFARFRASVEERSAE